MARSRNVRVRSSTERLQALLTPYRMKTGHWRRKVQEAGTAESLQATGSTGGGLVTAS